MQISQGVLFSKSYAAPSRPEKQFINLSSAKISEKVQQFLSVNLISIIICTFIMYFANKKDNINLLINDNKKQGQKVNRYRVRGEKS